LDAMNGKAWGDETRRLPTGEDGAGDRKVSPSVIGEGICHALSGNRLPGGMESRSVAWRPVLQIGACPSRRGRCRSVTPGRRDMCRATARVPGVIYARAIGFSRVPAGTARSTNCSVACTESPECKEQQQTFLRPIRTRMRLGPGRSHGFMRVYDG